MAHSKQTTSVWMQGEQIPVPPALTCDTDADVCVVGAGIAGMTTAYLLLRQGRTVVVLDAGTIGGGQTERTTAHLFNAMDDRLINLEAWHGLDGARLAVESHTAAIDLIEQIVAQEHIACDFERLDGYLFAPLGETSGIIDQEFDAATRTGLDVGLVNRAPLVEFDTGHALRFPRQGQFHPLKYLAGLRKAIVQMGGQIYCHTRVEKVDGHFPVQVKTREGFTILATAAVVATNTPFNDFVTIHTKQAPYISYVAGFAVPHGVVTKALYWDTEHPYHYARLQSLFSEEAEQWPGDSRQYDLLIVGGEDHKTGQADDAEDRYLRLEHWARDRFPISGSALYRWSGQVLETIDGLAFIGRNPLDGPNVFIATGDSGQGMTHGTIAGMLLTDMITGRKNPWEHLYDPARKTLWAAGRYLQENLNVGLQYGAWVTGGDVASGNEIPPGSGAVVRHGLTKVAAFRDEQGLLHECSAICPHLGCIVKWNHNECTWDCPCHGSRFDCLGRLLNGPAISDLVPIPEGVTSESGTVHTV